MERAESGDEILDGVEEQSGLTNARVGPFQQDPIFRLRCWLDGLRRFFRDQETTSSAKIKRIAPTMAAMNKAIIHVIRQTMMARPVLL